MLGIEPIIVTANTVSEFTVSVVEYWAQLVQEFAGIENPINQHGIKGINLRGFKNKIEQCNFAIDLSASDRAKFGIGLEIALVVFTFTGGEKYITSIVEREKAVKGD